MASVLALLVLPLGHAMAVRVPYAAVRAPVLAFNAGLLSARDYSAALCNAYTPTLVLSGTADKREADRRLYESQMLSCRLVSVPGCNVLPWESPRETCDAVQTFAAGLSA